MEAIKTSVTSIPAESEVKGKAVKKSGNRIGYNYIILKSLKESQKNDVVTCLYIKSLTNFGICVIKEGSHGDTKDKQGRDIKDRLKWQKQLHEFLQDKVRLPRLLGSFEENGNYYLVLERIRGKSLYKACKEAGKDLREGLITGNKLGMKFLDYMIQMILLLETLHMHGVVHRDVTATNFMITPAGKVAVIDMELSYSLKKSFPEPPFQLGTWGYMSPEQEATMQPAVEQDTYSVAAIILQVWTGISPSKLTNVLYPELEDKIRFFIPDTIFAEILIQCLHSDPAMRPSLPAVRHVITGYRDDLKNKRKRQLMVSRKFSKDEILGTVQEAIKTISSPFMADENHGWFSENGEARPHPDKKKINKAWYASFYKGAAGVIYMLSKANMLGLNVEAANSQINKGIELIEAKYVSRRDDTKSGLHFGSSGIASVLSTAIREGLIEPRTEYFEWINRLVQRDNAVMGFQHGIAGQAIACWLCHPFLHPQKVDEQLKQYADRLLSFQHKDGSWVRSVKNNKNKVTRGFAHGMAGIIYFLLEYAAYYNDKNVLSGAEKGLHWMIKKAVHHKDTIQWRSAFGKEIAPWWCDGATGIAMSFMKAYAATGEGKYKAMAIGALNTQSKNAIENNLSQCHGMSGLGEIYLEAYKYLGMDEWLERAEWVLQVIMHTKRHDKTHGPYWLVEHERVPVADFMIGNSGVMHYLLRYCHPDKIGFPLLA